MSDNSTLAGWTARPAPQPGRIDGGFISAEPALFPRDADALFAGIGGPGNVALWDYIPIGPFADAGALGATLTAAASDLNWQTLVFRAPGSDAVTGMASYMRIRPEHGSAEVGCVVFSPLMQRSPAATEAMYLMARHVFDDLGYRRYEWKCDNANERSKRAAGRLGFRFEGVFRQDMVMKGRNRDTAWFSMTDSDWPAVKLAMETWLAPENFAPDGAQRRRLEACRAPAPAGAPS